MKWPDHYHLANKKQDEACLDPFPNASFLSFFQLLYTSAYPSTMSLIKVIILTAEKIKESNKGGRVLVLQEINNLLMQGV